MRSALGAWFAAPAVAAAAPLTFLQSFSKQPQRRGSSNPYRHWWHCLSQVAPYARVSWVAPSVGTSAQFARALGTTCRVLIPQLTPGWALVSLPSGRLIFVSNRSYLLLGGTCPEALRLFPYANAGVRRQQGRHPVVRGTVRNPNDHPHGGRTRALRYPRTPWGRTAKCSRAPRALPRLKALAKRHRKTRPHVTPYWAQEEVVG